MPICPPKQGVITLADFTLAEYPLESLTCRAEVQVRSHGSARSSRSEQLPVRRLELVFRPSQRSNADALRIASRIDPPGRWHLSQGLSGEWQDTADVEHPLWRDHKRRRRCHRHPASHSPGPPSPAPSKPDKMQTQTPQVNNPSPTVAPALLTRHSREVGNPWVAPGSLLRHAKSPAIPLGIVQSKQLRIQSTINQPSINRRPTPPHP